MRILAVDTTTPRGSVALVAEGTLKGEVRDESGEGHSRWLLPAISGLLARLGHRPADVGGFAVTIGPGSFTGLRVGIATVQGLALASGRPCLGLSALDVLAAVAVGDAPTLVAMIDAYRDDVFAGVYDGAGSPLGPPRLAAPEHILAGLGGPVALVGDGAQRHRDRIRAHRPDVLLPEHDLFLAAPLARLAAPRLLRGEGGPPASLRPLYLREADIRR